MCASGVPPIWHDVVATHLRMRSTSVLERGPARVIASGAKRDDPRPMLDCIMAAFLAMTKSGRAQDLLTRSTAAKPHGSRRRPEARALVVDHLYGRRETGACLPRQDGCRLDHWRSAISQMPAYSGEGDHAPRFDGFHPWQPAWPSGCDRGRPIGGLPSPESTTEMRTPRLLHRAHPYP
jgi:hypothetical protein